MKVHQGMRRAISHGYGPVAQFNYLLGYDDGFDGKPHNVGSLGPAYSTGYSEGKRDANRN